MTQHANADVVRQALMAQNRGDDEAFRAALHSDIVWHAGTNEFGLPEVIDGPDEVIAAARAARSDLGELTVTLHEVREDGDDVFVAGALSGGGRTMPRAYIWTVRDGRAIRVQAFNSRTAALMAWERRHRR